MNIKFNYLLLLVMAIVWGSCSKDNFKAPSVTLSGRLTYKGDSVGVEYNQVSFQLYQTGYAVSSPITETFNDDGSYSVLTFNGNYKFTMQPNQGPFLWKQLPSGTRDTLLITLKGNQTVNIEVTPYYMVRNLKTSVASKVVTANFNIEQVITDPTLAKSIETVSLFINKTTHVSGASGNIELIARADIAGADLLDLNNITLNANIPSLSPAQNYVFARVGIKISGVEDWYYSPVRKIFL